MAVVTTPDTPLPARRYDVAVIGAGVLGLLAAAELVRRAPDLRVAIFERDGVPSESGASWASPGIVPAAPADAGERWARARLGDPPPRARGAWHRVERLEVLGPGDAGSDDALPLERALERLGDAQRTAVRALFHLAEGDRARVHPDAGWASAEALAVGFGHAAVAAGADLVLNARVRPEAPDALRLERVAFERDMVRRVARRETVAAGRVLLAAGAASADLAEAALGRPLRLPVAYRQYPRIGADDRLPLERPPGGAPRVALPLVSAAGATLRPQGEGLLLVPPELPPDPPGYEPVGGRLLGVPVGVRRDLLDLLLERAGRLAFLEWETLDLGKRAARVRGAWQSAPPGGEPVVRDLGDGWTLLAGGGRGLLADLAAAGRAAGRVLGRGAPWEA